MQAFLAGLHGHGYTHSTSSRCHVRYLRPSVLLWIITLNTILESVAIITTCKHNVAFSSATIQLLGREAEVNNDFKMSYKEDIRQVCSKAMHCFDFVQVLAKTFTHPIHRCVPVRQ